MTNAPHPDILFKAAFDSWTHLNQLMWNRLQTLSILQIPMLGASFALSDKLSNDRCPAVCGFGLWRPDGYRRHRVLGLEVKLGHL